MSILTKEYLDKRLNKKNTYHLDELRNDFLNIFFYRRDDSNYLFIDGKSNLLNINDLENSFFSYFKLEDSESTKIKILDKYERDINPIYLSFNEDSFKISLFFAEKYIILKEYPFDKDCYLKYELNHDIIMLGNKKDYFLTLKFKATDIDLLNFYQEYLQKEFAFKKQSITF